MRVRASQPPQCVLANITNVHLHLAFRALRRSPTPAALIDDEMRASRREPHRIASQADNRQDTCHSSMRNKASTTGRLLHNARSAEQLILMSRQAHKEIRKRKACPRASLHPMSLLLTGGFSRVMVTQSLTRAHKLKKKGWCHPWPDSSRHEPEPSRPRRAIAATRTHRELASLSGRWRSRGCPRAVAAGRTTRPHASEPEWPASGTEADGRAG